MNFELPGFHIESEGQDDGRVYEPVQIILLDFLERLDCLKPKHMVSGKVARTQLKVRWLRRLRFLDSRDFGSTHVRYPCRGGFVIRFRYDGRVYLCHVSVPQGMLNGTLRRELSVAARGFDQALARVKEDQEAELAWMRDSCAHLPIPEINEENLVDHEVSHVGFSEFGEAGRLMRRLFSLGWKRSQARTIPEDWEWVLEWTHLSDETAEEREQGVPAVKEITVADGRLDFRIEDSLGVHCCSVLLPPVGFHSRPSDTRNELRSMFSSAMIVSDWENSDEEQNTQDKDRGSVAGYDALPGALRTIADVDGQLSLPEVQTVIRDTFGLRGKIPGVLLKETVARLVVDGVLEVVFAPEDTDLWEMTIYQVGL